MNEPIQSEHAVNHILNKIKSSSVEFVRIGLGQISVKIGYELYSIHFDKSYKVGHCQRLLPYPSRAIWDDYAKHIENILNGYVRNDAGEMTLPR